jgi:hypothetical protein
MSHNDTSISTSSFSSSSSSSSSETPVETGMSRYRSLVEGRIVSSTKIQYERYLAKIKQHFIDKGKRWIIPIKPNHIPLLLEFFGNVASSKGSNGCIKASSTIGSYKSALKYGYEQAGYPIQDQIIIGLSQMMKGYRRDVAKNKQEGKMAVHEGNHI